MPMATDIFARLQRLDNLSWMIAIFGERIDRMKLRSYPIKRLIAELPPGMLTETFATLSAGSDSYI